MDRPACLKAHHELEKDFKARNPKSQLIYENATTALPGGNTRTALFYHPFPVSIVRAEGARLYDVDGHEYVDLLAEYTAGLYGHSEPAIVKAITEAAQRGLNFGGHHEDEVKLAVLVKERFPSMELLRFTNSGTEATLMALAAAKAYTGRKKILVFNGAYHGGAFSFKGGKSSPVNAPHEYLIARYNDLESVQALLREANNVADLAVILVEPMLGSGGAIPADEGFLKGLRDAASEQGAILIYDEVMTSRMHGGGGIQSQLPPELRPDMTTLGKWIGGGLSFGAFGGKHSIMQLFDPRQEGSLAHAGTFNNNVLTMSAGRAGMEQVFTSLRAQELHGRGDRLRQRLEVISEGTLMKWTGYGSIMNVHFSKTPMQDIKRPEDVSDDDHSLGDLLHLFLLKEGYYIARRGFISLSLALSDTELDGFVGAVRQFLVQYQHLARLKPAVAGL